MNRRDVLKVGGGVAIGAALVGTTSASAALITAPVSLFIGAHPDDITLGCSILFTREALAGCRLGALMVTDGEGSQARTFLNGSGHSGYWGRPHVPAGEGYLPLTTSDLATARVSEENNAVHALSSGLPSGPPAIYRAGLRDGFGNDVDAVAQATAAILAAADDLNPGGPVRLKGHSYRAPEVDVNHLAVGQAIRNLKVAYPSRFNDVTYTLRPVYWTKIPTGMAVAWALPATGSDQGVRVGDAVKCFSAWAPNLGAFAVGMHSTPADFNTLAATPKSLYFHS